MKLKIIGSTIRGAKYEYAVRGECPFGFDELLHHMIPVSKQSTNYKLSMGISPMGLSIFDNRDRLHFAKVTLETTICPEITKVHVFDTGIGKQMIEKYVRSLETDV